MNENEVTLTINGDERAKQFCLKIAKEMTRTFGISMSEAVGRINKEWKTQKIFGDSLVYHRVSEEWAKVIYYENGTYWWVDSWMAEHTPKPKPYP